jgi:hypothetical protein
MTAALIATALAVSLWRVAALSPLLTLSLLGAAVPAIALQNWLAPRRGSVQLAAGLIGALPCTALAFGIYLEPLASGEAPPSRGSRSCLAPSGFDDLKRLKPGLILGPINAGSHILAHTPHSVLDAPYHRNNEGNRLAIETLAASPPDAREIVERSRADYVVICKGEVRPLADDAATLFETLGAERPPQWLRQIRGDGPFLIYEVVLPRYAAT